MSGSSPIKGISAREDQDGSKTLHVKVDTNRYKCISNFFFHVKAFVKFVEKELTIFNGYILSVHRIDGVSMWVLSLTLLYYHWLCHCTIIYFCILHFCALYFVFYILYFRFLYFVFYILILNFVIYNLPCYIPKACIQKVACNLFLQCYIVSVLNSLWVNTWILIYNDLRF